MHADDMNLVREFAANGSETAFATLVERYVNLVYSAALRQLGNVHEAEEVAQAVFIILAQKASSLRRETILSGWLYQTTQFTAANFRRTAARRQRREQEAFMQYSEPSQPDGQWHRLAPLLEEAMSRLSPKERDAMVLRFFENCTVREVALALGLQEDAAQKRVNRGTEKMRRYFIRRGIQFSTTAFLASIGTHAVQAAPAGLAQAISGVAMVKGATASASTLTLVKGALKFMAWTKMKTAVAVTVGIILVGSAVTIGVTEFQRHRTYSWEVANFHYPPVDVPTLIGRTPPQVTIVRSKFSHWIPPTPFTQGDSATFIDGKWIQHTNSSSTLGLGVSFDSVIRTAYSTEPLRTEFTTPLPGGLFDFIANLPENSLPVMQQQIRDKYHLTGTWQPVMTNVLALRIADPNVQAFRPANSLRLRMSPTKLSQAQLDMPDNHSKSTPNGSDDVTYFNNGLKAIYSSLEGDYQTIIVNDTGLTNQYDFEFSWPMRRTGDNNAWHQILEKELLNQLGLKLVPTNMPIEMLVVEKSR